ncbi:MAG: tetratricopeptide repeat protein [Chthonomonadales bacterium]
MKPIQGDADALWEVAGLYVARFAPKTGNAALVQEDLPRPADHTARFKEAEALLQRFADLGDGEACWLLGSVYETRAQWSGGDDVRADAYFRRAAELNSVRGQVKSGFDRLDISKPFAANREAVKSVRRAARQNHPDSLAAVGMFYEGGYGVKQSNKLAMRYYRRSAKLGSGIGDLAVGLAYLQGILVRQNIQKSIKSLEAAAEQDIPTATRHLGMIYLNEDYGHYDVDKARYWLYRAVIEDQDMEAVFILMTT